MPDSNPSPNPAYIGLRKDIISLLPAQCPKVLDVGWGMSRPLLNLVG